MSNRHLSAQRRNHRRMFLLVLTIAPCLGLILLRDFDVISTRELELELLPVDWTFEEIVDYLDAPYPDGATNISYDSHRFDRGFFIEMAFDAPPASAMAFAESICDGVLFRGFDPFNAVVGTERVLGENLVLLGGWSYAYSPNTPETAFGNKCVFQVDGRYEYILVDASHPDLYHLRFEMPIGGKSFMSVPPGGVKPADFVTPLEEFPFAITGMYETADGYAVATDRICFETTWQPGIVRRNDWGEGSYAGGPYPDEFVGAEVHLRIDDELVFNTHISDRWTLAHPNQAGFERNIEFNYCHFEEWATGTHTMELQVSAAETQTHTWEFEAG
jgi:hypothetical protein